MMNRAENDRLCRIGPGAMIRDAVVLPGARLDPGAIVVGGVYGISADRPVG